MQISIKKLVNRIFKNRSYQKIAFIDGDQSLPAVLNAYHKHLSGKVSQTYLVRMDNGNCEPKLLRKMVGINKVYLSGFTSGKEVVDKFIGASIQKAIADGFTDISVISSDYDFIDQFKMAAILDKRANNITFTLIVPTNLGGRLEQAANTKFNNIKVVKA